MIHAITISNRWSVAWAIDFQLTEGEERTQRAGEKRKGCGKKSEDVDA
jgi:hypothetical protein